MDRDRDDDVYAAGGMAKNRVEALVDGNFGVAMTLLPGAQRRSRHQCTITS